MTAAPTPPGDELDLPKLESLCHRLNMARATGEYDGVIKPDTILALLARIKAQDAEIERLKKYAALSFRAGRSEAEEELDAR